jgi:mono/diheme cytochrome c family protein
MHKYLFFIFFIIYSTLSCAEEPFAQGDAKTGKAMVDKNCIECHAAKFGGDGSAIYTRENRKVNTSSQLLAQIRNCNTMIGLKWFEDEELNVAKYLNQAYYKFDK